MTALRPSPEEYRRLRQACLLGIRSRRLSVREAARALKMSESTLAQTLREDEPRKPEILARLEIWLDSLPPGDNDEADAEPTHRRRRTSCCPHLVMDGQPASYPAMAAAEIPIFIGLSPTVSEWQARTWSCPAGRGPFPFDYTWAYDVCTTTWHTGCAFQPDAVAAPPPEVVKEAPPPVVLTPSATLARRIRRAIKARKLTLIEVSLAMGRRRTWVSNALRKESPSGMRRIAAWLVDQQRKQAA